MKNLTNELQKKLDEAVTKNKTVVTPPGEFEVGALFIPSNVTFILSKDTVLIGSKRIEDYPEVDTRIAGIDMKWPTAILNVLNAKDVTITGEGTIDGRGPNWWELFWGKDEKSGMMSNYSERGLRWAVDYDCKRPRNILIFKSKNIQLNGINSIQSGFWNTQVTYSQNVLIDGISVRNSKGPSTDGIDIDSCTDVIVQNSFVECNDDNICIKSGRGKDAFENQTKCSNILIQDCNFGKGSGVTIGSEVSGGCENIIIRNIHFDSTFVGFRIKSANNRGGYIDKISISNLVMKNVRFPFLLQTNWFPEYSYAKIPIEYKGEIPEYWGKLVQGVTDSLGFTKVSNINIENVTANSEKSIRSRAFFIEGNPNQLISGLKMKNIAINSTEFGKISGVIGLSFEDVKVSSTEVTLSENDVFER